MRWNPSSWSHRSLLAALTLAGAIISAYLALVETGVIASAWDPYFGYGSDEVLRGSFSSALPIPDALAGCLAYLVELALDLTGGEDRDRTRPWVVLAFGALSAAMAVASLLLVALQAWVVHAWCTLCLTSAGISVVVFLLALPEVLAALRATASHEIRSPSHA